MQITLAGRNFDAGYKSDIARDQLAPGDAYRMFDYIPQLGSPLRRRGAWAYSTRDLNAVSAVSSASAVAWAPFQGDPHLVVVGNNGKVFNDKKFDASDGTFVGSSGLVSGVTQRPLWFADLNGMVLLPTISPAAAPPAPQKYTIASGSGTGTTYAVAALGGSPPLASVGAAYGDWLLLANGWIGTTRYANRIWASAVGQPETWTTTSDFFDLPEEIVRVVPLRSMILVFGYRAIWMLTGDTPPPGGNWSKLDAFAIGTMDGRSVVPYRDTVIFANNSGVYQTDGTTLTDLTEQGGVSQRWQSLVETFNFSTGWSCAAGVFQGNYIITIHNAAGNFVSCHVCDIQNRTWFEFTNLRARNFAERQSGPGTALADGHEELFFAHAANPRAGLISPCWGPTGATDADGTAVRPVIELPFYKLGSTGMKQIRNAWVTHDLRDGGATPYFQFDAVLTPNAAAYGPLVGSAVDGYARDRLAATTKEQRRPVWIRKRALGIGLRITQVNASTDTSLAEIEFEARDLTTVRRG